jgi:hypothetical protein
MDGLLYSCSVVYKQGAEDRQLLQNTQAFRSDETDGISLARAYIVAGARQQSR